MSSRISLRFSGSGGQGMILLGIIYGEAAILDGLNAVQTQSYGPEARGGASKSDVVISDSGIAYPHATKLDLLLCLSQQAYDRYGKDLKVEGLLVADSSLVREGRPGTGCLLPFTKISENKLSLRVFANMVALGAIAELTQYVPVPAIVESIKKNVPAGTAGHNLRAFEEGRKVAGNWKRSRREPV